LAQVDVSVMSLLIISSSMIRRALRSTPFPYTTLFRSLALARHAVDRGDDLVGVLTGRHIVVLVDTRKRRRRSADEDSVSEDLDRSEEHTSELQSRENLVCRLLLEKKKENPKKTDRHTH